MKRSNNYAFIDSNNLHLGIRELGWELDYRRFRVYLGDKYGVQKAFLFAGYVPAYKRLYQSLSESGYELMFRKLLLKEGARVKGNVDAELVLHTMIEYPKYDRAVIVTRDGDFACLVEYLYGQDKLDAVIATRQKCSSLLKTAARERIDFIDDSLRRKLERVG